METRSKAKKSPALVKEANSEKTTELLGSENLTGTSVENLVIKSVSTPRSLVKGFMLPRKPKTKRVIRISPRRSSIMESSPRSPNPESAVEPLKSPSSHEFVVKKPTVSKIKSTESIEDDNDSSLALHSTPSIMNIHSACLLDKKMNENCPNKVDVSVGSLNSSTESVIAKDSFHTQQIRFDLSKNKIHYISDNDFPKDVSQSELKSPKEQKSILKKQNKFENPSLTKTSERNSIDAVSACKITNGKYMYYTKEQGGPVTEIGSYRWLTLDQMEAPVNLLNNFWKSRRVVEAIAELRDWLNFPNFYTIPNQMLIKHVPLRKFSGLPSRTHVKKKLMTIATMNRRNRTERMWYEAKSTLIMQLIHERRTEQLKVLKNWQDDINTQSDVRIMVQNFADLEHPPKGYQYVSDYVSSTVHLLNEPKSGCGCTECGTGSCCWSETGLAYNTERLNVAPLGSTIVECNSKCSCQTDCPNRVVQYGPVVKLEIFRKMHGTCMWCVRTREDIPQGQFVFEFIGEVITREEARERSELYNTLGYTHLLDLDFNGWETPYTIDTCKYGNAARFLSHSCEPNLVAYAVFINNPNPNLPRIALFAARNIRASEELTFDFFRPGVWEVKQRPAISQSITDAVSPDTAKARNRCTIKPCRRFLTFDHN